MFSVTVRIDGNRRIKVYPQGGLDLECYVDGPGWVLDNDADVADHVLEGHLEAAIAALVAANSNLGCVSL